MRNTSNQNSYAAYRRWMEHTRKSDHRDVTTVRRYTDAAGDRVLLADAYMLTFIPYGALPETLLASATETRHWGTEERAPTNPDAVLESLNDSQPVYMTSTLHRLAGPRSLYHLLVTADGAPAVSVDADKLALVVSDPEADDLRYRFSATHCLSVWRGNPDEGDDAVLLGAIMGMQDTRRNQWYLTPRIIGLPNEQATPEPAATTAATTAE